MVNNRNAKTSNMAASYPHAESPGSLSGLPFIVSHGLEKPDPATRKLIRSHVMRGKKQTKIPINKSHRKNNQEKRKICIKSPYVRLEQVAKMYTPIPERIGSDFSLFGLADEVESSILSNITKVSPVAMRVIFPLITAIGFQFDKMEWLHRVAFDNAALNISAFAVEGFIDKILRRKATTSPVAMKHFQRGLELLRHRIMGDDDEAKVSDGTIAVVVKLASTAHFEGDYAAGRKHMEGLRRMVDLRGGVDALQENWIIVELIRSDLGLAMLGGTDSLFFCHPSESVPEYPQQLLPRNDETTHLHQQMAELFREVDQDLATAWQVMRKFCLQVNIGTDTQRFMHPDLIYDTMTAVMYRLLRMSFTANSLDEAIWHGLLAYSFHVFLQWQDIRPPYEHIRTTYKHVVGGIKPKDSNTSRFILWLLMVGAVSIFEISEEEWLKESLYQYVDMCGVKGWRQMNENLKKFLWIPLLDEQAGKKVCDALFLGHDKSSKNKCGKI